MPQNTKENTVNLDELLAQKTVIIDGKEQRLVPIDAVGYQIMKQMAEEGEGSVLKMYEVAARCLPDVPKERVMQMSATQIGKIVSLGSSEIEAVEATASKNRKPKGKGQEAPSAT